jgi:hypothetical protein
MLDQNIDAIKQRIDDLEGLEPEEKARKSSVDLVFRILNLSVEDQIKVEMITALLKA